MFGNITARNGDSSQIIPFLSDSEGRTIRLPDATKGKRLVAACRTGRYLVVGEQGGYAFWDQGARSYGWLEVTRRDYSRATVVGVNKSSAVLANCASEDEGRATLFTRIEQ